MVPYAKLKKCKAVRDTAACHGIGRNKAAKLILENTDPKELSYLMANDLNISFWFVWFETKQGDSFWGDVEWHRL